MGHGQSPGSSWSARRFCQSTLALPATRRLPCLPEFLSRLYLVFIWSLSGLYLVFIWSLSGLYLVFIWSLSGL
jgi:hypothetical protein